LSSKVVIVTGAASGIGRELCRLFGRRRAKIGLVDRKKSKLESFADELCQAGVPWAALILAAIPLIRNAMVRFRVNLADSG